jgi:hypothetical protein
MTPPLHRPTTEEEAQVLAGLASRVDSLALLRVTATGLAKRILDANVGVRDLFCSSGFHDYDRQPKGVDHRVVRNAALISGEERTASHVSLYRPETKKGDPRMWITGLDQFAREEDLLALVIADDELLVFDVSSGSLTRASSEPTEEDGETTPDREQHSVPAAGTPTAQEILSLLKASSRPLQAKEIAWRLSTKAARVTRKDVNAQLYGELSDYVTQNTSFGWSLVGAAQETDSVAISAETVSLATEPMQEPHAIAAVGQALPARGSSSTLADNRRDAPSDLVQALGLLARWGEVVGDRELTLSDVAVTDPTRWPLTGAIADAVQQLRDFRIASGAAHQSSDDGSGVAGDVQALLAALIGTRDGAIFAERHLAADAPSQQEIAVRLNLSIPRIGQLEARGRQRLDDLLSDRFQTVSWACHEVRWRLGPMAPVDELHDDPLGRQLLDEDNEQPSERRFLVLHLLGFAQVDTWLGAPGAPFPGDGSALEKVADANGVIGSADTAADRVASLGIKRRYALQWLASDPRVRRVDGAYVRWDTTPERRAHAVLATRQSPLHIDHLLSIVAAPGEGSRIEQRLRAACEIDDQGNVIPPRVA